MTGNSLAKADISEKVEPLRSARLHPSSYVKHLNVILRTETRNVLCRSESSQVQKKKKKEAQNVFMHFVSPCLWAVPVFLHYDPAGPRLSPGSTSPTGYPQSQPSWPETDGQRRWKGANKGIIVSARVITNTQVNVLLTAMHAWKKKAWNVVDSQKAGVCI